MPETELEKLVARQVSFAGPIPPAADFAQYENTLQGAADRILSMAENEAKHRREIDAKEVEYRLKIDIKEIECRHEKSEKDFKVASRGQIFAFVISVLSLGAVALSVLFDKPAASIAPTIIAITGLASIFVSKKK